jgi:hypothetical protein
MNTDPGILGPAHTALGFSQKFVRGMSAAASVVMIHRIPLGLFMLLACCGCFFLSSGEKRPFGDLDDDDDDVFASKKVRS